MNSPLGTDHIAPVCSASDAAAGDPLGENDTRVAQPAATQPDSRTPSARAGTFAIVWASTMVLALLGVTLFSWLR
jgi:hypothetical protein